MNNRYIDKLYLMRDYEMFLAYLGEEDNVSSRIAHDLIYGKMNRKIIVYEKRKVFFNRVVDVVKKFNLILGESIFIGCSKRSIEIKISGNIVIWVSGIYPDNLRGLSCDILYTTDECVSNGMYERIIPVLYSSKGKIVKLS